MGSYRRAARRQLPGRARRRRRARPAALSAVEADPDCFTLRTRFPGGFTPHFGGNLKDYSVVTGVTGLATPRLTWDASASIGTSDVDQFIYDTVNASLGYDTPTAFSPGAYRQQDIGFNVDISYAASDRLNVAAGTEWRQEAFTIRAGDRPSWEIGPYATTGQGFSSGSNGFNGYRPENSGTWKRSNVAVYGDLELTAPDGRWTLGGAVRAERYADFGGTVNGKVSARVELAEPFALRGAASTGFRAPTPGQQNAFNVSTAFAPSLGDLVNEGTVPPTFRAAGLRGGEQLRPETSRNYTFGGGRRRGPSDADRRLLPDLRQGPSRPDARVRAHARRDRQSRGGGSAGSAEPAAVPVLRQRLLHPVAGYRPGLHAGAP